jgi:hypothetical protein
MARLFLARWPYAGARKKGAKNEPICAGAIAPRDSVAKKILRWKIRAAQIVRLAVSSYERRASVVLIKEDASSQLITR